MRWLRGSLVSGLMSAWLLPACLGGCATSALNMAPERPDRPWSPVTTAGGEIVAGARNSASPARDYVLPANAQMAEAPPGPSVDSTKVYGLADLIDLAEA